MENRDESIVLSKVTKFSVKTFDDGAQQLDNNFELAAYATSMIELGAALLRGTRGGEFTTDVLLTIALRQKPLTMVPVDVGNLDEIINKAR
jgi:hypothetical protein